VGVPVFDRGKKEPRLEQEKISGADFVACCFYKVFSRIPTGMFDPPDELVLTAVNQLRLSKYVSFHRALKTAVTLQGARLRSQLHPCQNLVILRTRLCAS
jgi:hypothetical protein